MMISGRRVALMVVFFSLAALAAMSGCGHRNGMAPGAAVRVAPRIRFLPANAGAVHALPDSLSAEALDDGGNVIAGPVALQIVGSTFRGQLDVPAGTGRRIRVIALEKNTIIYEGRSGLIPVSPSEVESVDVALRASTSLALIPNSSVAHPGDSLLVTVVDTALSPIYTVSAHVTTDFGIFDSIRVRRGPDLPAGADLQLVDISYASARPAHSGRSTASVQRTRREQFNYQVQINALGVPGGIPAGAKRLAVLVFYVNRGLDCSTGDARVYLSSVDIQPDREQHMPVNDHDAVVSLRPAAPGLLPIRDTFDSNDAGWTAVGDPVRGTPVWNGSGGNPGGYISATDAGQGSYWYFRAPLKYHGDFSAAYGRPLKFDLIESSAPDINSHQVVLRGGGGTLFYDTQDRPGVDWSSFRVLLREGPAWTDSATGTVATQAQFQGVLGCLSDVLILGEYVNNADTGGLDNVIVGDTLGGGGPQSSCVSGRVTFNGSPVSGATVVATGGATMLTASDGTYCLSVPSNTLVTITVDYTQSSKHYHGSGSVGSGSPANCGGVCSTLDVITTETVQGKSRFSVNAFAIPTVGPDSGVVEVIVSDDSLSKLDTSAVVTIIPDNGSPVRLTQQFASGLYYASAAHIPGVPSVPMDQGRGYTLQMDLEGDGTVDAQGTIKLASALAITNPIGGGSVRPAFDMTWTVAHPSDSLLFFATIDSTDMESYKFGYNVTSFHFDNITLGAKRANLIAWTGPYLQNAIFGGQYTPNILGARVQGYFYSFSSATQVDFSVTAVASPRRASAPVPVRSKPVIERFLSPRQIQALRKIHALAHQR